MMNMRRTDRLISEEEAFNILKEGEYGIMATVDGDGQPLWSAFKLCYH